MNKKGILGLDTTKAFVLGLLLIGILLIVMFFVGVTLRNVYESTETLNSARVDNESVSGLNNVSYTSLTKTEAVYRNIKCTLVLVQNSTSGVAVPASNYTQNNCFLKTKTSNQEYNGTIPWNVTYTYTYNNPQAFQIVQNLSIGGGTFGSYSNTFLILMAVVVLVLIITIVIVAVSRFGGVREGGVSLGGFGSGEGSSLIQE